MASDKITSDDSLPIEPQTEEQQPDYGSMPASNIGEAIGALGGDEWKEQVRRFDNAPIRELLGVENPRKTLPVEQPAEAESFSMPDLKEWEVYDFNIGDDMPENPYPETTWRDHITSPMGKLAFDATLFNRKEVIDNTDFEGYFGEGVNFLPALRNRFRESMSRRQGNSNGNIDFGYGMDAEAWADPMNEKDEITDALQFMLKKGDFVYDNDHIYLASEYNFSQRDMTGDPVNLDITDVPYLLERFSTDATKGDLWVGKAGFGLGDKLRSAIEEDDNLEGPSIRLDLGSYTDIGLTLEQFNELKNTSNSAGGVMGSHSFKSIAEYEEWKSGLKSINPRNVGKWAGVSKEEKRERERGAKKRKEAKKKTDAMGLTKVGKTRATAAKKVREYSDKFNELIGR